MTQLSEKFSEYDLFEPKVPVFQLSRPGVSAIHRFYDTSPISPTGRFVVYTEFDYEDRLPNPGDCASVVVLNLRTGNEVYRTRTIAWDTQLGAQAQWGHSDEELFFNRMTDSEWKPFGVMVNPTTGVERRLAGPVYMVSPDGRTVLSPNLVKIWNVQPGYGVIVPPRYRDETRGAPEDDGLFVTDVDTGDTKLAVSLKEIYDRFPDHFADIDLSRGGFYGFHVKWSPDGRRIMFIVRWRTEGSLRLASHNWMITMDSDFTNLRVALGPNSWRGGHHPNWCPNSQDIVMNLMVPSRRIVSQRVERFLDRVARKLRLEWYPMAFSLRFVKFRYDGSNFDAVSQSHVGSGHPTWHEALDAILTDAYPWETVANGDGTSPIRLLSVSVDSLIELIRIRTQPLFAGPSREWRIDPHPAWNYQADAFVFNGYSDGKRAVFIADMRECIDRYVASYS